MEIQLLGGDTIRLKGKHASLVVDPLKTISKTTADGILILLHESDFVSTKVEGQRVVITGPGGYEVGGVKISVFRQDSYLGYDIHMDGIDIFLTQGNLLSKQETMQKIGDKIKECHIVIVHTKEETELVLIPALSPRVSVFYGEKAKESALLLDKDQVKTAQKYQATWERLPSEMEVVALQ